MLDGGNALTRHKGRNSINQAELHGTLTRKTKAPKQTRSPRAVSGKQRQCKSFIMNNKSLAIPVEQFGNKVTWHSIIEPCGDPVVKFGKLSPNMQRIC
jgi:hypothetical protein